MDTLKLKASVHKDKIESYVRAAESLRRNATNPQDVTLSDVLEQQADGISMAELYADLGIDPCQDTIQNLFTVPDASIRWLVPEIFRDALRLGLRKAPIYPNIIAAEQSIKNLTATIPSWNMSDAKAKYIGEGESISMGTVSVGSRDIKVRKIGRGIKVSYEVKNYVAINVVSIFLQDFGVRLGYGIDTMLIDVLLNGDQGTGVEAAPVIGVAATATVAYKDLLTIWVRMARLGRTPTVIIAGETVAINTLSLPEFATNMGSGPTVNNLNLKTPVPKNTDYYIHGNVPASKSIIIDTTSAVIKFNAQPLLVETEKIVSNQTEATYATLTTGFGTIIRDARVVMDQSQTIGAMPFPTYMDPTQDENIVFD